MMYLRTIFLAVDRARALLVAALRTRAQANVGPLALVATALWAASALPVQAETALPQRNLLIEIRTTDTPDRGTPQAGLPPGSVVVSTSGGNVDAQGGVTLRAGSRQQAEPPVQRLAVQNGHRATLRLMQSVPLQFVDSIGAAASGSSRRGKAARTVVHQGWTEAGTAFSVLPRWPGGHAPVTVDIEQTTATAPDGDTGARHDALVTTLSMPMNEWETIAQDGADPSVSTADTVSTRDVGGTHRHRLQIRVSAP